MLHSHPQRWNGEDNDEFSLGDGLVAAISGKIYLTTPHGEVYALTRKDAPMVITGNFDWNKTYQAKYGDPRKNKLWTKLKPEEAQYYQLLDYGEEWEKMRRTIPGYNYETFDIKTYNTYQ